MKVVHLAMTPLAGAPIRLVQALNACTDVHARLVNLNPGAYGTRTFDEDLDFTRDRAQALELLHEADLVHCHHWMDLRANPFGVDLSHKVVLRQFHSEPGFVARHAGVDVQAIVDDPLPQVVIAQFHERFYPRARPVPNLINFDAIDRTLQDLPAQAARRTPVVSFAPTSDVAAGADRWNTKGAPETRALLGRLGAAHDFVIDAFENLPHAESLRRKAAADVVIDELVTGSYHLSGLEALALGRPTLGYLDTRMVAVLAALTGSDALPWVNVHLGAMADILPDLLKDSALCREVGQTSAAWMREHWATARMVDHYVRVYEDVLDGRTMLRATRARLLQDQVLPDLQWLHLSRALYEQREAA